MADYRYLFADAATGVLRPVEQRTQGAYLRDLDRRVRELATRT